MIAAFCPQYAVTANDYSRRARTMKKVHQGNTNSDTTSMNNVSVNGAGCWSFDVWRFGRRMLASDAKSQLPALQPSKFTRSVRPCRHGLCQILINDGGSEGYFQGCKILSQLLQEMNQRIIASQDLSPSVDVRVCLLS
jgi:hypothetical protein